MATHSGVKRVSGIISTLAALLAPVLPVQAGDWMPLLPDQDMYDFQLFAPPDLQEYEIWPEADEGMFFNYDRLIWGITVPRVTAVGNRQFFPVEPLNPDVAQQLNNASGASSGVIIYGSDQLNLSLDTSWMRTRMSWGNRFEGGWIYDNKGVMISYLDSGPQSQSFQTTSEFAINTPAQTFTQGQAGSGGSTSGGTTGNSNLFSLPQTTSTITTTSPPPDHMISQRFTQTNSTRIQSGGVAALIQRQLRHAGSNSSVKFGLGPRFVQLEDRYNLGYNSREYAFPQGGTTGGGGGGTTGGGTTGGGTTGGGTAGGGTAGGGTAGGGTAGGGTAGGGTAGGGTAGGIGGGTTGGIGGGFGSGSLLSDANALAALQAQADASARGLGSPLQNGAWETYTSNNMVGPEFSINMSSTKGRWTVSSDLKFTAGLNWQNNLYRGSNFPDSLAADYFRTTFTTANVVTQSSGLTGGQQTANIQGDPLLIQIYGVGSRNATNSAEHNFTFTPIGEWRLGTQFRVSQGIMLHAGYTGMWMGQIARASTNTAFLSKVDLVRQSVANPAYNPGVVLTNGSGAPVLDSNGQPIIVGANDPSAPVDNTRTTVQEVPVRYSRIGAAPTSVQNYVLSNGLDFGIEVKY